MTATAAGAAAAHTGAGHAEAALWLALLSGGLMRLMGVARLGFVARFLSHPVVSGFVSASALLIAASQLKHLRGIPLWGDTLPALLVRLAAQLGAVHGPTLAMGIVVLAALWAARCHLKPLLQRWGVSPFVADIASKAAPVLALVLSIALAAGLNLAPGAIRAPILWPWR